VVWRGLNRPLSVRPQNSRRCTATNPRVYDAPMTPLNAIRAVRLWLDQPEVEILVPGEGHADIVFGLIEDSGVAGNLTSDAHLAAIAIEYQAELASNDRDFGRFRGLRWLN
jgi:toxin-antitoxin system PIN domain toxin